MADAGSKASGTLGGLGEILEPWQPGHPTASTPRMPVAPTAIRLRLRRIEGLGAWLLWSLDLGAAALAWESALRLRASYFETVLSPLMPFVASRGLSEALPPLLFLAAYSLALYSQGCYTHGRPLWVLLRQFRAAAMALLLFLVASYLLQWFLYSRAFLVLLAVLLPAAIVLEWGLVRLIQGLLNRAGVWTRRVLVVGTPRSTSWVLHDLVHEAHTGVRLLGLLTDEERPALAPEISGVRVFHGIHRTARLAAKAHAEEVVLCLPDWPAGRLVELLQTVWPLGVRVHVLSPDLSVHLRRVDLPPGVFHGLALLDFGRTPMAGGMPAWKRCLDLAGSAGLLVALSPLLALIALLIRASDGRPVFYGQERCGTGGRRFRMWKFRTMHVDADQRIEDLKESNEASGPLFKIRADPRVTPLGRFLRRHSLDELPQLWNVLQGEMSLVGPRPPLPGEVAYYEAWHHARLAGAAGCTGLWQVSGRSDLPFEEGAMLDIYYLHNMSPRLDVQVLFRTVWAVLAGQGAY